MLLDRMGEIEVIMRCDGSMSRASWLDGRQVPILLQHEKGGEKFLPTCVHFHVTLLVNSETLGKRPRMRCLKSAKIKEMPLVESTPMVLEIQRCALTNRVRSP